MKVSRALVTGGAGFIGSHIAEALVERGVDVCVVDNMSTGLASNLERLAGNSRFKFIATDVRNINEARGIPEGIDVVFHEAAIASVPKSVEDPLLVHDVNVNASLGLLEFCVKRGVKRFVFASSAAVYGAVLDPPAEEADYCAPGSPYGASKLAVENYMHAYGNTYGLETVALRYFNVYGPRQRMNDDYSGVIALFARQLLGGETPTVYGDGNQTRDFVYVTDVARANLLAMEAPEAPGEVINVATGRQVSILELLDAISKAAGQGPAHPKFARRRKGDLRVGQSSIAKAATILGYSPQMELERGIGEVVKNIGGRLGVGVLAN